MIGTRYERKEARSSLYIKDFSNSSTVGITVFGYYYYFHALRFKV